MKLIKSASNSVVNLFSLVDVTVDHSVGIVDKTGQIVNNSLEVSVVESEKDLIEALGDLGLKRDTPALSRYEKLESVEGEGGTDEQQSATA